MLLNYFVYFQISSWCRFGHTKLGFGADLVTQNSRLVPIWSHKIKKCYIIGESANFINNQIKNYIKANISKNLSIALKKIFLEIKDNKFKSTILFSPACSSFDQFKNFEERGNKFKVLVNQELNKLTND